MEERLQKYMATCGVASRRKCEEIILEGRVRVNGEVIRELGFKVTPGSDEVLVDSKPIFLEEKKVYIALHKPEGVVSTVKDERNRKTIIDLVDVEERVYPIGRLDYNTSGLILLTNDGDVYNKLIHPREEVNKIYIAVIKGIPSKDSIYQFCNGVDIGGYITAKANFRILEELNDKCKVKITIHEGKNRQIRKMCDVIGHPVIALKRVAVGKINLGTLEKGKWRNLDREEVEYLKSLG
ncbi:ribosomal large subunit pseudouridine synthase B [Clostridium homopropionicum DSM 5847]|uniref:Pseudouridine synthase n=1 Tax=Clostridium homopropionicum DSM 5847 TaxID=1121318 RepID=A0A0L6ZDP4_9CLOT|nr:pseudouridine synthase [Clostridium homopropionicum]KOA20913.1 ribosomal large subunit pseudouridine synthase B [Clostridium homopropionicum DSM 5847]SFG02324.1 23S rRNA pseudouridine2605 synthase [Clostridium homopropionicum]